MVAANTTTIVYTWCEEINADLECNSLAFSVRACIGLWLTTFMTGIMSGHTCWKHTMAHLECGSLASSIRACNDDSPGVWPHTHINGNRAICQYCCILLLSICTATSTGLQNIGFALKQQTSAPMMMTAWVFVSQTCQQPQDHLPVLQHPPCFSICGSNIERPTTDQHRCAARALRILQISSADLQHQPS